MREQNRLFGDCGGQFVDLHFSNRGVVGSYVLQLQDMANTDCLEIILQSRFELPKRMKLDHWRLLADCRSGKFDRGL